MTPNDLFDKITLARGLHRKLVQKVRKPFDIMYYSDKEWEKNNSLINAVKETGEVIYPIKRFRNSR